MTESQREVEKDHKNEEICRISTIYCRQAASGNAIVNVTNNAGCDYQLQSFTYVGAPSDYKVIENGEIVPGASIFGAIVVSADTAVTVTVNGAETAVNIPNGGVVF